MTGPVQTLGFGLDMEVEGGFQYAGCKSWVMISIALVLRRLGLVRCFYFCIILVQV
jgi:hypothetical protein